MHLNGVGIPHVADRYPSLRLRCFHRWDRDTRAVFGLGDYWEIALFKYANDNLIIYGKHSAFAVAMICVVTYGGRW